MTATRSTQAPAAPVRDPAPDRHPQAGRSPGTGDSASAGNVDTSLRDRINRLSSARTNLLRKRDGARAAAPAEQPSAERFAENPVAPVSAPVSAPVAPPVAPAFDVAPADAPAVDPDPMIAIDEPVVVDRVAGARSAQVDLTSAPAPAARPDPMTDPAPVAPASRTMPDPVSEPVARPHPRQSARRRDEVPNAEVPAASEWENLPTPRRSTAPEVRRDHVQETTSLPNAEVTALATEVKNLRREMAELRSEMRDLKDAGPGGLGPVERAVQRLAQRMDRVDGGAQPLINDGRLEQRPPRKSGFFGWFGRR